MPKCQIVNPDQVRKSGHIEFKPIPVNQYHQSIKDESKRYSKEDLVRMQRDMIIIRTFENMLNEIKLRGSFMGICFFVAEPRHHFHFSGAQIAFRVIFSHISTYRNYRKFLYNINVTISYYLSSRFVDYLDDYFGHGITTHNTFLKD